MTRPTTHASNGARLVTTDGRALPLRAVSVRASCAAGEASVRLVHDFQNTGPIPLQVSYQVPLPADAAVAGYAFSIGGRRVTGRVAPREQARQAFEEALIEGRTAALLEQDRSSLFSQEVGNIPAGATVTCELQLDQPLIWRTEGVWEWRFPTVVAPRYLGALASPGDASRVTVDIAEGDVGPDVTLALGIGDVLAGMPSSPSHGLELDESGTDLRLTPGASLDRDLVVRWPVAGPKERAELVRSRAPLGQPLSDAAYGLLTLVPPAPQYTGDPVARDLIVLLDTSGSMGGEPLDQAKRVVGALIESLGPSDRLEMIEFSDAPRRWKRSAKEMNAWNRGRALRWLAGIRAGGCTEMRDAIIAALSGTSRESQRQVLVVSDGLIGFEEEVIRAIGERRPPATRVHTLGVGHGVNRTFTAGAARAGAGTELCCAPGEDVEPILEALLARTARPIVVDVCIDGSAVLATATRRACDLMAGAPAKVPVSLRPEGGRLRVTGRTADGTWERVLEVPATAPGEGTGAAMRRFARESVEELELERTLGASAFATDGQIERLGVAAGIATRLTSWVAVSDHVDVDPRDPTQRVTQPHALAAALSAEGVGLRAPRRHRAPAAATTAAGPVPAPHMMRRRVAPGGDGKAKGMRRRSPAVPAPSPNQRPFDHIGGFNVRLDVDGTPVGRFRNVEGLDDSHEFAIRYAAMFDEPYDRNAVEFKRSDTPGPMLNSWIAAHRAGSDVIITTVAVVLTGDDGTEIVRYALPALRLRAVTLGADGGVELMRFERSAQVCRWPGKARALGAGRVVIRVVTDGRGRWQPGEQVTVRTEHRTLRATVDPAGTTRASNVGEGVQLRLVLELDEPWPEDVESVRVGGVEVDIE